jgi:DNA-binding transcriptional regulator/RsmH inhibitor MraZ
MAQHTCPPIYERQLDDGRLTLPEALHARLGGSVVAVADLSGSVLLTGDGGWEAMLPALQECSAHSRHATELFHVLSATQARVMVDARGRLTIPRLHMEWAGLMPDRTVLLLALHDGVQVWDPRRFSSLLNAAGRHLRRLSAHVLRDQLALFPDASPQEGQP